MRLIARIAFSIALVVVALFPNVPRLASQFSRVLHPDRLVDPNFRGSDEALELLRDEMASLAPAALLVDQVKVVDSFVRKHVTYARDWDLYGGNLHDWPTPEEVWRRGSDDCDGIAVLSASLLQRLGIKATLEYNAFHCWARAWESTGDGEWRAVSVGRAIRGPTASKENGRVDWISLGRDLLRQRTWTEGLSFPLWRIFVALAAVALPWIPLRLGRGFLQLASGRPGQRAAIEAPGVQGAARAEFQDLGAGTFHFASSDPDQSGGFKRRRFLLRCANEYSSGQNRVCGSAPQE